MWQQRQSLSVGIWFQDGAHLRSASTVRVLPVPPPLTQWLILDFVPFCSKFLPSWPLIFLVCTIRQVIWTSPGALPARAASLMVVVDMYYSFLSLLQLSFAWNACSISEKSTTFDINNFHKTKKIQLTWNVTRRYALWTENSVDWYTPCGCGMTDSTEHATLLKSTKSRDSNFSDLVGTYLNQTQVSIWICNANRRRMEKSHSGCPRTAWCVVNMFHKNGMSPLIRTNGTIFYKFLFL